MTVKAHRSRTERVADLAAAAEPVPARAAKPSRAPVTASDTKRPGKQFVSGQSSPRAGKAAASLTVRTAAMTPATHPEWFTAAGERKWKASPKDAEVIANTGEGDWNEKWRNPKDGKWVHNYTLTTRAAKEGEKFAANRDFGSKLGAIKRQYTGDLKKTDRTGVIALMVALIDRTYFRVGNEESKDNGVYGVTTLLKQHVSFEGDAITFKFIGKKKQENHKVVTDPLLAAHLKALWKKADGPDARLFTDNGAAIHADQLNEYLSPFGVTAKQFRTYHATKLAFTELSKHAAAPVAARAGIVKEMFDRVAKQLVHTPAVCRQSYVDPAVIRSFMDGRLV